MVRFVLRIEPLGKDRFRVVKPETDVRIPAEEELSEFDPDDVGIGTYLVFGANVREHRGELSEEEAKQWIRNLNGAPGKEAAGGLVRYRVYRLD